MIVMYRVPGADEAWRNATRERIVKAASGFREELAALAERHKTARGEEKGLLPFQEALVNNQLAWLVSNTEGDFDEALKCSLRSLALWPNRAGFLDTLGRCYYAKGDYANAVKVQSQAVALEPHSPPMLAQLELFRKALETSKPADDGTR
jgi:tetratricopeptide (TPR) repeat protein